MATPVTTTRVFNNGNSQAVRIPAEFRLNTDRVQISRNEQGDLVIHPIPAERGQALFSEQDEHKSIFMRIKPCCRPVRDLPY